MKNDDSVEVWNDPELEAKVVAMFMGELSAFEVAEMEEELANSPELRLFRDRIEEASGLILEADEQAYDDDEWKLSSERRSVLLETFSQDNNQALSSEGATSDADQDRDEVLVPREFNTSTVQWRNVISIAACLLVSFVMAAVLFPFKKFIKSSNDAVAVTSEREFVSYSAEEDRAVRKAEVLAGYRQKVQEQEDRVEDNRARLYKLSKSLGIPYHGVNSQVATTYQDENNFQSAEAIYSEAKRERDALEILVKDANSLDDKRLQTRMIASNRAEGVVLGDDDKVLKNLLKAKNELQALGVGASHPRVESLSKAIDTTREHLKETTRLTRAKLSNDLVAMNKQLDKLKKDADSQSGKRMVSAEEHTQFGKVKDEYEREFAMLQTLKEGALKEEVTDGLDRGRRSAVLSEPGRSNSIGGRRAGGIDLSGGTSHVMKLEDKSRIAELPEEEDIVWSGEEITKPRMTNEIERKPSSPSSSVTKTIAANSPSPVSVPMPNLSVTQPSLDFGDGDDFGDGWGDGRSNRGLVTKGARSSDYAVTRESIDAFLNSPSDEKFKSSLNSLLTESAKGSLKNDLSSNGRWPDRVSTFNGIASSGEAGKDITWTRTHKTPEFYFNNTNKKSVMDTSKLGLEHRVLVQKGGSLVQKELVSRSAVVSYADKGIIKGREAYKKGKYEKSVAVYEKALALLPQGPIAADRRASFKAHLIDGKIALSSQYRRTGRYDEARELLNEAIAGDPGNKFAQKQLKFLDDPIRTSPTLTQEHVKGVEKVRANLYRGEAFMNQGQFDSAINEYKKILKIDPYNKAARRGMEKTNVAKNHYYRASYDQTRAKMLMEVDQFWEASYKFNSKKSSGRETTILNDDVLTREIAKLEKSLPSKENKEAIALYESIKKERASNGKRLAVRDRLQNVKLANVEFTEDTTVRQAINILRLRQRELDSEEVDPMSRKLDFKFRNNAVNGEESENFEGLAAGDSNKIEDIKLGELNLRNVPMEEALRQICQKTGLRYKIDENGINILRATDVDDSELYTRTFRVPENFEATLRENAEERTGGPFEEKTDFKNATVQEILMRAGIPMPEGASAIYSKRLGAVTMRNTANSLDLLEEISDKINQSSKVKPGTLFLEAYETLQNSKKSEAAGDIKQALFKQKHALQVYQNLATQFPQWRSDLVKARLKQAEQQVRALEEKLNRKPAKKNLTLPQELSAAQQTHSTFSLNVSDVSFELARITLLEKAKVPEASKIRVEEFVNAFDYGDPSASGRKVTCAIEQAAHPMYQQRNLMRIGMKTGAIGRTQPLRLTILLDNSGSMEREDREATVLKAMQALASKLGPQDEVTLLSFARDARLVAHKIKGSEAAKLVQYVKSIPSEGGTNLSKAISQAHAIAKKGVSKATSSRIVLITDGAANLGNADPEDLSESIATMRQEGIAFDACGVGADGLNDELLEALTRKGDGRYYFINKPEDANAEFAEKLAGALRPAAKNVKVQVVFNPDRVGNYRLLGFEKHRLKKQDFRNDKVDAAEMAAEEAGNALYQIEAKPDGRGDIGTVFVRFLDVDTGQMVERSWTIPYHAQAKNINDTSPSLQLASVAGLLGEKLRFGDSARIDLHRLNQTIGKLRAHYHNDKKVLDLLRMVERTKR